MSVHPSDNAEISLLTAVFGVVVSPRETLYRLFVEEKPKHAIPLTIVFVLTFIIPMFLQRVNYRDVLYNPDIAQGLVVIAISSIAVFIILESILLRLFGVPFNLRRTFALVSYSLLPVTFFIWLMYWMNYYCNDNISFLVPVLVGNAAEKGEFVRLMPWITILFFGMLIRTFFYAIKFHASFINTTAFVATIFSVIPLYVSLVAGVMLADIIQPGALSIFYEFMLDPSSAIVR